MLISTISTSVAATTFFQGVRLIGPSQPSILSAVEPVASVIAASVLFTESLNIYQGVGGLFIVLAAIATAFSKRTIRH